MESFTDVQFWYWWVFALFLIAVEVFAPGAIALWMGISAGVVGGLVYLFPDLLWEKQIIIFAVLSIVSVALWRMYARKNPPASENPNLNKRGSDLLGQTFVLTNDLKNGVGRETVNGVIWKIKGGDLPQGTKVSITSVEGTALIVEPAEA